MCKPVEFFMDQGDKLIEGGLVAVTPGMQ